MKQSNLFSVISGAEEVGNGHTFRTWILADLHSHRLSPDKRFRLHRLRSIAITWRHPMGFIPPNPKPWSVRVVTTFNLFDITQKPSTKARPNLRWHKNWIRDVSRSFESLEQCESLARRLLHAAERSKGRKPSMEGMI